MITSWLIYISFVVIIVIAILCLFWLVEKIFNNDKYTWLRKPVIAIGIALALFESITYSYYLVYIEPNTLGLNDHKIGILFLGGFVGWVLGLGLQNSGKNVKIALTVISAALTGGPVVFLKNVDDRWCYPIGLVVGFLFIRLSNARKEIIENSGSSHKHRFTRLFAWLDVLVISILALLSLMYSILI